MRDALAIAWQTGRPEPPHPYAKGTALGRGLKMPRVLREFLRELRRLQPAVADVVWDWLDRCPTALGEMIELVGKDERN